MDIIKILFRSVLEDEFNRGYSAGVSAEKLVKAQDDNRREYDILQRGKILGREELLKEMESDIEEISAEEFDELAKAAEPVPFGFVGSMENMTLILRED